MRITNEVLEAYLNCKTKGHLKLVGQTGTKSEYEAMTEAASIIDVEERCTRTRDRALIGKGRAVERNERCLVLTGRLGARLHQVRLGYLAGYHQ